MHLSTSRAEGVVPATDHDHAGRSRRALGVNGSDERGQVDRGRPGDADLDVERLLGRLEARVDALDEERQVRGVADPDVLLVRTTGVGIRLVQPGRTGRELGGRRGSRRRGCRRRGGGRRGGGRRGGGRRGCGRLGSRRRGGGARARRGDEQRGEHDGERSSYYHGLLLYGCRGTGGGVATVHRA